MKKTICIFYLITVPILCFTQPESVNMFMFGHSLVNYESENVVNDQGKIAHWIYLFAEEEGYSFASTGQYGFLPSHTNLPPSPNWGYELVPSTWDIDNGQTFADANFNSILITPGNFMQWQSASEEYPNVPGMSPISASEMIFDWTAEQEDEMKFYIYENWPDMVGFLNNGFPASNEEFAAYNEYTVSEFNQWWLEYQDAHLESRPEYNVRMIPVGPIISKLHNQFLSESISIADLYEDDAPHGTANTYFLAGLISYMAIYERPASLNFEVPDNIHSILRENYDSIVGFVWSELQAFNTDQGKSRVFYNDLSSSTSNLDLLNSESLQILPNPNFGLFEIISKTNFSQVRIIDTHGKIILTKSNDNDTNTQINASNFPSGIYLILTASEDMKNINMGKMILH